LAFAHVAQLKGMYVRRTYISVGRTDS